MLHTINSCIVMRPLRVELLRIVDVRYALASYIACSYWHLFVFQVRRWH